MRNRTSGRLPSLVLAALLPLAFATAACEESPTQPPAEGAGELQPGHALLSDGTPVDLQLDGDLFLPGEQVAMILRNGSSGPVGHNLCFHTLEVQSEGEWETAEGWEDQICTLVIHFLEPGGEAHSLATLPQELAEGTYRLRVAVSLTDRDEFRDVVSPAFQVSEVSSH
jgi:hypothetical protein